MRKNLRLLSLHFVRVFIIRKCCKFFFFFGKNLSIFDFLYLLLNYCEDIFFFLRTNYCEDLGIVLRFVLIKL